MSEVIFCPACHHKNEEDAKVCSFCGTPLTFAQQATSTTEKMASAMVSTASLESLSKRYLPKLPDDSFALFVMDDPEPLIIENTEAVYLGRFVQTPTASSLDLTKYGAAELGVSRSHARIIWRDGIYQLEDLASTNGTWLNYQRLAFGKSYELHNGDILLLGQLQLTICLPESLHKWEVTFDVRRNKTLDTVYLQILTPYYLETVVSKFLQALVELQQVSLQCRGQSVEEVHILSIKAADQKPLLHISLDNANEAILQVRKWINPLRELYAAPAPAEGEKSLDLPRELLKTVDSILLEINPTMDDEIHKNFAKQLKPAVETLTNSELEIVAA
jgi:hypothetical protein